MELNCRDMLGFINRVQISFRKH